MEGQVLPLGRLGRADRPAMDAGRPDADEQPSVEPGVTRRQRATTSIGVQDHGRQMVPEGTGCLVVSEVVIGRADDCGRRRSARVVENDADGMAHARTQPAHAVP